MKISGTLRNLFFLAILAAGVIWLWQEGKLAPIEKTVQGDDFWESSRKAQSRGF